MSDNPPCILAFSKPQAKTEALNPFTKALASILILNEMNITEFMATLDKWVSLGNITNEERIHILIYYGIIR